VSPRRRPLVGNPAITGKTSSYQPRLVERNEPLKNTDEHREPLKNTDEHRQMESRWVV